MGNSVRSTLGNLCGGNQANKEGREDFEKPVAKPKESKKEKKNKKNKKNKNGDLAFITEETNEKEEPAVDVTKTDDIENTDKKENKKTNLVVDSDSTQEGKKEPLKTFNHTEEITKNEIEAESTKYSNLKNETHDDQSTQLQEGKNEKSGTDLLNKETTAKSIELPIESAIEIKTESVQNELNIKDEQSEINISADRTSETAEDAGSNEDMSSTDGLSNSYLHYISNTEGIETENISVTYADDIFTEYEKQYQPFVECTKHFKSAVFSFNKSIDPDEISNFEKCWNIYQNLLSVENNSKSSDDENTNNVRTASKSEVDICDINANLQQIRATGLQLINEIESVKPRMEKLLEDAGTVNVAEYVKGKMVEGEQLGITSKFSAPGKYRRNMKNFKKGIKQINGVDKEVKDILRILDHCYSDQDKISQMSTEQSDSLFDTKSKLTTMSLSSKINNKIVVSPTVSSNDTQVDQSILKQDVNTTDETSGKSKTSSTDEFTGDPAKTSLKDQTQDMPKTNSTDEVTDKPKTGSTDVVIEDSVSTSLINTTLDRPEANFANKTSDGQLNNPIMAESEPKLCKASQRESVIIPVDQLVDHAESDFFAKLNMLPMDDDIESTKIEEKTGTSPKGVTLLEQSGDVKTPPLVEEETKPKTYVLENVPEGGDSDCSSVPSTPKTTTETFEVREIKSPAKKIEVENDEEDHNTLEFGKYIFIDPSTGDIQTMRTRSKSLDSLVSMTSNRSSISKFGSFELVTDFEINIAEKNQENFAS